MGACGAGSMLMIFKEFGRRRREMGIDNLLAGIYLCLCDCWNLDERKERTPFINHAFKEGSDED